MKKALHFILIIIVLLQSCSCKKEVIPMKEDPEVKNHILNCKEYIDLHQRESKNSLIKKIEESGGWNKIENAEGASSENVEFDINGDGYNDNISKMYSGGSTFGGLYIEMINGYSNEKLTMNNFSSFGDVSYIIPIENEFLQKENEEFKKASLQLLLPNSVEDTSDPFLNWILLADSGKVMKIDNSSFNKRININSNWYKFSIENLYQNTYLELFNYDKNEFYTEEGYEKDSEKYENAWLVSNKFNTGIPSYIGQFREGKLFFNNHTVYILKNNMIKYVFINYNKVFDGVSKLRWPSVKQVKLIDKYVFIIHQLDGLVDDLVVVDLNSGDIFFDNQSYGRELSDNGISIDSTTIKYKSILKEIR